MKIFKACDIRGIAGSELTDPMARRIALAVGHKMTGATLVVGGDVRRSTPRLMRIVLEALAESGCRVLDAGIIASPVFYYALKRTGAAGGIMITASHNPAPYNGFKLVLGPDPVTEKDIQEIAALVVSGARSYGNGTIEALPVVSHYLAHTSALAAPSRLKVVVDCGSGATSGIAPRLFRARGYEVVELFCEADGDFPHREPNPALPENLERLGAAVREHGAALGIAFDGDGDRVGVVDENGRPADNDDMLVLLAHHYLKTGPGTVIYDAKCSMVVPEEIVRAGGRAVMARAGHTFSKAAFLREEAVFAGEISGHFFFRELGYDDGMFAGLKIGELVTANGPLSAQVDSIPNYILTTDIRVPYAGTDKERILDEAAAALSQHNVNRIDGVRLEFADGWGMIRSSVTEPLFTLRFEARTAERLHEIAQLLLGALPSSLRPAVLAKLPPA